MFIKKNLFLVGIPKSLSTQGKKFNSFSDQMVFIRLYSKKVLPGHIAWVIS